jgi:hypothetical protein
MTNAIHAGVLRDIVKDRAAQVELELEFAESILRRMLDG